MTAWFGADWGAPACDPEDHVETPVGEECCRCKGTIKDDDQGLVIPGLGAEGRIVVIYHLDCFMKSILPCPGCVHCQPEKWS